jgi:molybdopterin-guanine dinucleotide biosynthesis protein A
VVAPPAIVAVLAGGRGRRLGGGKPTTLLAGSPLICHVLAPARAAALETIVVAKRSTRLPPLDTAVHVEPELPRHPLNGVHAALQLAGAREPAPAVVLLACDMPFVTAPLLAWIAALPGRAMTVLDGRPQPLLARLLPADREAVAAALAAEEPLIDTLRALAPRLVGVDELSRFGDPRRLCFNVNRPEDLALAERCLAEGEVGGRRSA